METIEVKESDMGDMDMEETRPMRLIDGRLVVWHLLDSGPAARQAEPARAEPVRSEPVQRERVQGEPSPPRAAAGTPDDPDATRSMRVLSSAEDRRLAPR